MGHLAPQLPIARALAAAGHEVAFSTYFPMAANVEAAGFAALATGPPVVKPPVQKPLLEPDREREDEVMRTVFAGRLTRERMASVPEHVEAFRPDALVCDENCRAVISHGGSGTFVATLAHGLPSVLIPLGADQLVN